MDGLDLEFSPTTRFIEGSRQSIMLDLESRKWVKLPRRGLEVLRQVLARGTPAEAGHVDSIETRRVENTIRRLQEQGFLRLRSRTWTVGAVPSQTRQAAAGAARSRTLYLHLTQKCNLACTTCFVADHLRRGPDPLGTHDVQRILAAAAECGFSVLNVTGGEPLLRKDLLEILELARRPFRWVTLTTNGLALTAGVCRRLSPLVDAINVSLDGATAEVNDRIRGEGTYARALRGLATLRASGYPMEKVAISPTVTRVNHERLEEILDLAAGLGASAFFGFFMPTGRGLCNQERLTLGGDEMLALFERVAVRKRALGPGPLVEPAVAMDGVRADCHIGGVITVQADGSLFPCPNLNQPEHCLGNSLQLGDAELRERLRTSAGKARYLARTVDRTPSCSACECRYFCGGGCMANAYVASGDLYGRDPYCAFYRAVWRRHGPLQENYGQREEPHPAGPAAPPSPPKGSCR